jgi:hypothetical protein
MVSGAVPDDSRRLKMMRNDQVVAAWWWGREAKSGNIRTDGRNLWSYNLLIGKVTDEGRVVLDRTAGGDLGFVSKTTSRHVNLAKRISRRLA